VIAFEPVNEGWVAPPLTDAVFQAWLTRRHGQIATMNAALGTSYQSFAQVRCPEIVSVGKKNSPKEARETPFGSPARAMWYEYALCGIEHVEASVRRNHQTIRSVSGKPVNDRNSPIIDRNHGGPQRLERWIRWHDHLGTHVQQPYELDRTRGYSEGKPMWLTEYYWNYWGGSWGHLRYRLHGSLMLPVAETERHNLLSTSRNFWRAISRGAEAFSLYGGGSPPVWAWNRSWAGPCAISWPDLAYKRSTYSMKYMPQAYDRFSGEIQGSHTESPVALVEPIASRLQLEGSILEKTTTTIRSEIATVFQSLLDARIQSDPRPPSADLTAYRYVFLPSGLCLATETTANLLRYVRAGGTLVATIAPGVYDEHTRPDGRILIAMNVTAEPLPLAEHKVILPARTVTLPHAAAFAYRPGPAFQGTVHGTYEDGRACWLDAPVGKGRIVLVGFAMNLSRGVVRKDLLPAIFSGAVARDWKLTADENVDCFVRVKDGWRIFFLTNKSFKRSYRAELALATPRDVIDLSAEIRVLRRKVISIPRLWPGQCRILKVRK